VEHHAASFRRAARDEALADSVHADWRTAPLLPADRALAEYAEALTLDPAGEPEMRHAALRAVGWDDAAILRATEIIGYFNFVNRLADGLGVELEPSFT
jgi:uncharacterized peroxidase-related enzyme